MQFIIGTDIGTSGTKAIAFTTEGSVIGTAYVSYSPLPGPANHHELDVDTLFNAVITCLSDVLDQTRSMGELLGVSFSSAMHSFIAVDNNGHPLTNIITWADLRATHQAKALKDSGAGKDIYQHTGTPVHPMSPLCKIMWLKEHQPEIFAAAYKFISIKEYVFYKLFGKYVIDQSVASGTGLFDIASLKWYAPALAVAGITTEYLSEPVSTTHALRELKKEYAEKWQIDEQTAFIAGASDGCLANLGSNAVLPGDLSVTIGTSGAVRMVTDHTYYDPQERVFNYILADKLFVCGGPINNAVMLLKWYAEHFLQRPFNSSNDIEWFVQQAAKAPAASDGLIFLPYLHGERAPVWDAQAKGVFFGIHAGHTQEHFMRAIVEGINYALYQVAQSVQETVGPTKHIYASGGFIHSKQWLQWLTNLFGKEIAVTNKSDASSIGAAILGLHAVGAIKEKLSAHDFIHIQERFSPNEQAHKEYMTYYPVYASLYSRLKDLFNFSL